MSGFFSSIASKGLGLIFGLVLLVGVFILIVKIFLPPPAPLSLAPAGTVPATPSNPASNGLVGNSQPAIALPDQVTIKAPKNLEKGAISKIYINNDNNQAPEPDLYSPSRVIKTSGLTLHKLDRQRFEQISGYIIAPKTGLYSFTIANAARYNPAFLQLKIDGNTLPTVSGGQVDLEQGVHQIEFFAYLGDDTYMVKPDSIQVTWGRAGETLKPLQVMRESS
jgi:hypothetical protein